MAGLSSAFRLLQTARNTAAAGLTFALSIAVGIWFTPFLVGRIGAESYGLVMLAAVIVSYAGPVVQSLSTTFARAFAFAETRDANRDESPGHSAGGPGSSQRLMDDAMGLALRIALAMAVVLVPFALFGPRLLGISAPFRPEASAILALTGAAFVVWVLSAPYAALLYCRNRLDLGNYSQLIQTLLRVGGAAGLILWLGAASWMVPAAGLAGAILAMIFVRKVSAAILPLQFSYRRWRSRRPRRFARTGSGVLIASTLTMLLLGSELLVVNYMADETVAGRYAAAMQIPVLVRSAMLGLAAIAGPTILAHYADGAVAAARVSAADAMKRIGMVIALPTGITLAIAPMILTLWLGSVFAAYGPVVWLGLLGAVFTTASMPLYALLVSADRTMLAALFRGVGLVLFLVVALVLFRATELGVVSVAAGLCLGLIVPEVLLMAPLAARVTKGRLLAFLKPLGAALLAVGVAYALSSLLAGVWLPRDVFEVCLFGGIVGIDHAAICLPLLDRALLVRLSTATLAALKRRHHSATPGSAG